jgi:hypothetical protein
MGSYQETRDRSATYVTSYVEGNAENPPHWAYIVCYG